MPVCLQKSQSFVILCAAGSRPVAHSTSNACAPGAALQSDGQSPAAQHAAAQQTQAACPGLPDVEACLKAAIAAGRRKELEVAVRFAVRGIAAADPDLINVSEVIQ